MYSVVIIGGGIVGLATALKIKQANPAIKLAILEKESTLAAHQTGHNSGVIHSGIYYKPGSLKATNCINGYNQLVDFCEQEEIPYELCGKVIVATDQNEVPALNNIYDRGVENGLTDLKKISAGELKEIEPHVNGVEAIFVPQTGIIDYKRVANKYAEIVKHFSGEIFVDNQVMKIKKNKNNDLLTVVTNNETFTTRLVVNCAGLYSDKVAHMMGDKIPFRIVPFRGEYYKLREDKEHLVKNLIYPVPDPAFPFLGVHFTRMIEGGIEAGPNAVLAFRREGYKKSNVNLKEFGETLAWPGFQKVAAKYWKTGFGEMYRSFSKSAFTKALQKLMPEVTKDDLISGGAGVRAQACDRDGGLIDDFLISEGENYINVCNAPSPAATSSLSIGETVSKLILKRF